MRRRHEIPKFDNIDITNLIDILMVLLLTFMITIPPTVQKKEKVKLPEANVETRDMKTDIEITVSKDGTLYLDKASFDLPSLRTRLERENASKAIRSAVISADENVPYEKVLEVVECLQGLKIPSINLAAAPRQGPGNKTIPPLSDAGSSPPNEQ